MQALVTGRRWARQLGRLQPPCIPHAWLRRGTIIGNGRLRHGPVGGHLRQLPGPFGPCLGNCDQFLRSVGSPVFYFGQQLMDNVFAIGLAGGKGRENGLLGRVLKGGVPQQQA